jgi:hypothetical protein
MTLEQLEGSDWGGPRFESYLVQTIHALRRKPISEFTVEDLRVMIGQQIGLQHLVPIALDQLQRDPFVSSDFYKGDLLGVVAEIGTAYWLAHPIDARRMETIAGQAERDLEQHPSTGEIRTRLHDLLRARPWRAA